jgi:hypothetical protein
MKNLEPGSERSEKPAGLEGAAQEDGSDHEVGAESKRAKTVEEADSPTESDPLVEHFPDECPAVECSRREVDA